jgi:hypothetical protein
MLENLAPGVVVISLLCIPRKTSCLVPPSLLGPIINRNMPRLSMAREIRFLLARLLESGWYSVYQSSYAPQFNSDSMLILDLIRWTVQAQYSTEYNTVYRLV